MAALAKERTTKTGWFTKHPSNWKEEMENALSETREIMNHNGPLMTLYVKDNHEECFIDDVYGKVLNPIEVKKARLEVLAYFRMMNVYETYDIKESCENTGNNQI